MKPLGDIKFVNRRLQFIREEFTEEHINDRNVRIVPKVSEFWDWLDRHEDITHWETVDIRKAWKEEKDNEG